MGRVPLVFHIVCASALDAPRYYLSHTYSMVSKVSAYVFRMRIHTGVQYAVYAYRQYTVRMTSANRVHGLGQPFACP